MKACLARALIVGGDRHDFDDDVVPRLMDHRAQFWQRGDGVAVTEIIDYPKRRELIYWLAGGNLRDCLSLQPDIEGWAIAQGATRATSLGRAGWVRVGKPLGFSPYGVALRKDLVVP